MQSKTPLQSLWLSFVSALHEGENYSEAGEQLLPSDAEIKHGMEIFLTSDKNREAVGRLDFNGFDHGVGCWDTAAQREGNISAVLH